MNNEWFEDIVPLQNTQGRRSIAVLPVNASPTFVDLRTLFGPLPVMVPSGTPKSPTGGVFAGHADAGHYYAIKADGLALPTGAVNQPWRAYVHFSSKPSGTLLPDAVGVASGVCWPILDGETMKARLAGGLESLKATGGYATMCSNEILTFGCRTGVGTGWLRIRRVTLRAGQSAGEWGVP